MPWVRIGATYQHERSLQPARRGLDRLLPRRDLGHVDLPSGWHMRRRAGRLLAARDDRPARVARARVTRARSVPRPGALLDVGAGAGLHSLALQHRGIEIMAIDIAPECVAIMRERGVRKAEAVDLMRSKAAHSIPSSASAMVSTRLAALLTCQGSWVVCAPSRAKRPADHGLV